MKKKKFASVTITILIIGACIGYLLYDSLGEDQTMVYYKTVEEVLQERTRFETQSVRVNGLLLKDSVVQKPGTDKFRFKLSKNGTVLTIEYSGILPDSMMPGRELIVQGVLVPGEDMLNASEILTKCPSKYEEEAQSRGGQ